VVESDRVAGFLGNHANAVAAMLAASSIGAIWTGVSPDTGVTAVLERLVQIEPKVLFVDNAVSYNGKVHGSYQKVQEILRGLKGLKACVMFETVEGFEMKTDGLEISDGKTWRYQDFVNRCVILSFYRLTTPVSTSTYKQNTDKVILALKTSPNLLNSLNCPLPIHSTSFTRAAQPASRNA
jgi:hypothetical protein